jgi:ribosomal protein S13
MLQMIKNAPKLSSEEKAYCACVLVGYDKTQQIAEKLNLPDEPPKKKPNKKPKNQNINNISNPIQEISIEKQLELEQQRQLRRVRKIRQSIKEKAKLYGIQNLFC